MGDGVTMANTTTQKSAYAGVQGEAFKAGTATPAVVAVLGGKFEKGSTYFAGQVEVGSALGGNVELGKSYSFGKGYSADVALQAGYKRNNVSDHYVMTFNDKILADETFHRALGKAGVKGMVGYSNDKFSIKGGVEAGYRTTAGNFEYSMSPSTISFGVYNKSSMYASPKIEAGVNVKHISLNTDLSLNEGSIGVRYNF